jgi:FtsP/CotA-like multicopper oxidase with cupredoxin domain
MLSQPIVELKDDDRYTLRITPVTRTIAGIPIRFYAYNGAVPGPLLKVRQGATVTVDLVNGGDQATTLHWHGLRLDSAQEGIADAAPPSIAPGATRRYTLRFTDEGMYWYHPHTRADFHSETLARSS